MQRVIGTEGGETFLREYLSYGDGRGLGNFFALLVLWPFYTILGWANDAFILLGVAPAAEADKYGVDDIWNALISQPAEITLWLGAGLDTTLGWFDYPYSSWGYRADASAQGLALVDAAVWAVIAAAGAGTWYAIYLAFIQIYAGVAINALLSAVGGLST